MTEQKNRISLTVDYIRAKNSFKKKIETAVISYHNPAFLKELEIIDKIPFDNIPHEYKGKNHPNNGDLLLIKGANSRKNIIFLNGRYNFYEGFSMRAIAHPVYVLRELGVKTIIFIDEVGYLNPRFETGSVSLIYDHINLMGDNPLIGENDDTLGPRFPDMSNAYDFRCYDIIEKIFIDAKFKFYPSVYLGIAGPETETEAECRFYRDIGADVLGYSLVPENQAAIHAGMKAVAIGMISRELVADRLREISKEEQDQNRLKAEKAFAPFLKKIINSF